MLISRKDVYAKQKPDGSYIKVSSPVTEKTIKDHLRGDITMGAYQLDKENKVKSAIPVLNKNICGKRLNFFIFRNHFIYTDFFYLGSVGKVHDYPNFDSFFHR